MRMPAHGSDHRSPRHDPGNRARPGPFAVQRLPCHAYAEIARQLGTTYAEAPVSLGLQSNGNLLQVFSSAESGSWTIVSIAPDGSPACSPPASTGRPSCRSASSATRRPDFAAGH